MTKVTRGYYSHHRLTLIFVLLIAFAPISNFGAAKNHSVSPQLSGYKAVRVHYGPLNKMLMPVRINGQPASLLVDTGSNEIILDTAAAATFGVGPPPRRLRYIGFTEINGQMLPVAFMQSLTAGNMSFGSSPVVLRDSSRAGAGKAQVDGVLGLEILLRHKAVINCRTRLIFFKVDHSLHTNLSAVALSEKFIRVPLRREASGALTVPCSTTAKRAGYLWIRAHLLQLSPTPFSNRSESPLSQRGYQRVSLRVRHVRLMLRKSRT